MSQTIQHTIAEGAIIPSEEIRQRLAVATTEASLLRSMLRVAIRKEREELRLRELIETEGGRSNG